MHPKSQKDFWSGLMFLAAGAAFAIGAMSYSMGQSARPGPGYFPLGLGALLAMIGLVITVKSVLAGDRQGDRVGGIAWRPLLVVVGSILLFAVALPRLGLIVSLPLLVAAISAAGDEFRWRDVLLTGAVLTLGSWAVFIKGLGLVLPLWPSFIA
jgi:hypothetical protein